jgi:hypothetical protein
MIVKKPKQYLYMQKGAGIGSFIKSLFNPTAIKNRIKTFGRNILEKGKAVVKDVLQPALKETGKAVLGNLMEQVKQKVPHVGSMVQENIVKLAKKTNQQPFINVAQTAAPILSKASQDVLNQLLSGSGLKYVV